MSEGVSNIYRLGKKEKKKKSEEDWYPVEAIDPDLQKTLVEGIQEILNIKDAQTNANVEIKEIKENLEAKGIPKEVLNLLLKMVTWTPAKRAWFHHAYPIAKSWAFDQPQKELFSGDEK